MEPPKKILSYMSLILLHPGTMATLLIAILILNLLILPMSILQVDSRSCGPTTRDANHTVHLLRKANHFSLLTMHMTIIGQLFH
jgi:hypothetical protein